MKSKSNSRAPHRPETPYFYIKTLGCQVNAADSNAIASHLSSLSMKYTEEKERADVIVLNTCTVRDEVEHNAMAFIGRLKALKLSKPALKIVISGCAAERLGQALKRKFPFVDLVTGAKEIGRFPEIFDGVFGTAGEKPLTAHCLPPRDRESPEAAFITITRGCENFCSYCIVPQVRGPEISRPAPEIIAEIEGFVRRGFKEVVLLGQNVNSYSGLDAQSLPVTFPALLKLVNAVDGLKRVRFMTSHPKDLSGGLIEAMTALKKVCGHLHLPLQSGSDSMLKAMNRGYTAGQYLELVEKLRARMPAISLTTDILVGFPGETKSDFQKTLDIIERARFNSLYAYKYSPREGTASFSIPDNVTENEKDSRLDKVREVSIRLSKEIHAKLKGGVETVLVERAEGLKRTGRTGSNLKVFFDASRGKALPGSFVEVKIRNARINTLLGELVS